MPGKMNILNSLDRKLMLDQKVYNLLADKRANAIVTGNGNINTSAILKPASLSLVPVWPLNWLVITLGMLAGFLFALPICFLADSLSKHKISNRESLDKQTRIPFIGAITSQGNTTKGVEASISQLCTRVLLQPTVKTITFASTDKGAGKTFISTRFAQAFAAMDKKVLVIDMNHTDPGIAGYFDVHPNVPWLMCLQELAIFMMQSVLFCNPVGHNNLLALPD